MFKHIKRVSLCALLAISASGMSGCLSTAGWTVNDSRALGTAVSDVVHNHAARQAPTPEDRAAVESSRLIWDLLLRGAR